jgi:hypothetical protein
MNVDIYKNLNLFLNNVGESFSLHYITEHYI